jgi:hypothetical protein
LQVALQWQHSKERPRAEELQPQLGFRSSRSFQEVLHPL